MKKFDGIARVCQKHLYLIQIEHKYFKYHYDVTDDISRRHLTSHMTKVGGRGGGGRLAAVPQSRRWGGANISFCPQKS